MTDIKRLKPKKCPICGDKFEPFRQLQKVCGHSCAIELAQKSRAKKERKELKEAKERIKSRGDYAREAQVSFNGFIRARDDGKPCISCGSFTGKKNAGHYRSVGSCPGLRYEESNVHLQCEKCNSYLSGNLINYRRNLIEKIGIYRVEWIEGPHEPKKYSIEDLKQIKATYRKKYNDLMKGKENDGY